MRTPTIGWAVLLACLSATLALVGCGGGGGAETVTESPTPTPEPTGTNTPAPSAVCRDFAIREGQDGEDADSTVVIISALSGDASEQLGAGGLFASGPFQLCASPAAGNKQDVTLLNDVTVAASLPQSNCACLRALSDGTHGTLYGGPDSDLLDFKSSMSSNGTSAGSPAVLTDGPGTVSAKGDLRITIAAKSVQISADAAGCTVEACSTAVAAATPTSALFTTGTAVSEITNARQGGTVSVQVTGKPFVNWADPAAKGSLAGGAVHREDVSSFLGTNDVAVVERIAEQ